MILNTNVQSDVKTFGELSQNRVTIDAKNIDFITQILSSNLYSKPLNSFLREIISNAVDSHKEAGTKDPIILDIGKNGGNLYFRIQDFGTGISKERFDSIYRFIGSSTKRESNEFIGSFGLGKFSVLSIGDAATITSVCDGVKTKYLMYRDGMAINIDELSSDATTDRNGVEIYVEPTIDYGYSDITSALQELVFFKGLYINLNFPQATTYYGSYSSGYLQELKTYVAKFNARENKEFNSFCVSAIDTVDDFSVVLGTVLYRVDSKHCKDYSDKWKSSQWDRRVFPRFDIGELSVTPNREELLYDEKTEKALKKKFEAVDNELIDVFADKFKGDLDYKVGLLMESEFTCYFDKDKNDQMNIRFSRDFGHAALSKYATIYGEKLSQKELSVLALLCDRGCPFFITHSYNGRVVKVKEWDISIIDILRNQKRWQDTKYFKKEFDRFDAYLKAWMKEYHNAFTIVDKKSIRDTITEIKGRDWNGDMAKASRKVRKIYFEICKGLWDSLPAVTPSLVTQEYKDSLKEERTSYVATGNINVTRLCSEGCIDQQKMTLNTFLDKDDIIYIYCSEAENLIPKKLCNISNTILRKDADLSDTKKSIAFVQVSEKVKAALDTGKFANKIHYSKLLSPDRYWMKFIYTMQELRKKDWYKNVLGIGAYSYGLTDDMKVYLTKFNRYLNMINGCECCAEYIKPFAKNVTIDEDLVKELTPSDSYIKTIRITKKLQSLSQDKITRLFLYSLDGVEKSESCKTLYEEITNICSKDDKEHNQDEQVPECNA